MPESVDFNGDITQTIATGALKSAPPHGELKSWKHFRLIERVGAGGFGEVYRAFDTQLHREVALKLLFRPDDAENDAYSETLREARALARVRHSNVVPVYGVDRDDSRIGLWSEFIQGRNLASLLQTQGAMSEREALQTGIDVSRAVVAVHGAGLLHRDIKAANVIREDGGRILLMDFGLSHEVGLTNQVVGTPHYMAPELFTGGQPSVATDIYAVGVLLYHLFTKAYPVEGENWQALREAHEQGKRHSLFDRRPDLSPAFVQIVETAIDPDSTKRYVSAGQVLGALSGIPNSPAPGKRRSPWWILGAATIIAAVALAPFTMRRFTPRAVGGTSTQEHYLTAQKLLERYDKPGNIERAVDEFNQAIAGEPGNALAYAGLARTYWQQFGATRDSQYLKLATEKANEALRIDQQLAPAHIILGRIQTRLGNTALATQELERAQALDRRNADVLSAMGELYEAEGRKADAKAAIGQAIDLAPDEWRYHNQLGLLDWNSGHYAGAVAEYQQAATLTPDNPQVWNNLGNAYFKQGKLSEAQRTLEESLRIAKRYRTYSNLGGVLFAQGKYQESAKMFELSVGMNPLNYLAWGNVGAARQWSGAPAEQTRAAYQKAADLAEEARVTAPKDSTLLGYLGSYRIYLGQREPGLRLVRQSVALDPDDQSVLLVAAQSFESAGLRDEALRFLQSALDHGLPMVEMQRSPEFSKLRLDPHYRSLTTLK